MKYGVYIIEDCGTGTRSMPFYAESDLVAKRQFAATLRTLPPSVRGDFKVDCIACYDDFTLEFASDRRQILFVAVLMMIYQRLWQWMHRFTSAVI